MVHQTIQYGRCQLLVVEYCVPFVKRQVGRYYHTAFLIAFRDGFKQQLGANPFKGDIAPFIQDQDIRLVKFLPEFCFGISFSRFTQ